IKWNNGTSSQCGLSHPFAPGFPVFSPAYWYVGRGRCCKLIRHGRAELSTSWPPFFPTLSTNCFTNVPSMSTQRLRFAFKSSSLSPQKRPRRVHASSLRNREAFFGWTRFVGQGQANGPF